MRRIARDYLAIQGSATPSERAFSSGGITGTARRNSLSTDIFEALQILKSAYRNQHVAAVHQAAEHVAVIKCALSDCWCVVSLKNDSSAFVGDGTYGRMVQVWLYGCRSKVSRAIWPKT